MDMSDDQVATMLAQKDRGNYEGYTKKEVKKTKEARRLQGMLGGLSSVRSMSISLSNSNERKPAYFDE